MSKEMETVEKTEELVQKSERQLELEERRKFFHGEPLLNVVKKDEFQKRVAKVFKEISDVLACSFGASGAPTIIRLSCMFDSVTMRFTVPFARVFL